MTEKSNELAHSQDSELDEQNLQELLENVPEDVLIGVIADRLRREPDAEVRKVVRAVSQQEFSGPIPPPSMLGEYDEVHAGLANRIVSMAESQQLHRQTLEKQSVEAAIKTESRGQHYALALSVLIIIGSLFLIATGKEVSGTVLAGGTLTGLAYIFITGRKKQDDESSSES